jgi:hypothetical protein
MIRELADKTRVAAAALATRTIELDCDRLPFRYERLGWAKLLN